METPEYFPLDFGKKLLDPSRNLPVLRKIIFEYMIDLANKKKKHQKLSIKFASEYDFNLIFISPKLTKHFEQINKELFELKVCCNFDPKKNTLEIFSNFDVYKHYQDIDEICKTGFPSVQAINYTTKQIAEILMSELEKIDSIPEESFHIFLPNHEARLLMIYDDLLKMDNLPCNLQIIGIKHQVQVKINPKPLYFIQIDISENNPGIIINKIKK